MRRQWHILLVCWCTWAAHQASAQDSAAPAAAPAAQDPAQEFLAEVEGVVELHDWLRLLDLAEPQHREAQLKRGVSHAQYVAELLGLNYEGNTLQPAGQALASEHLLRIRQITWKRRGRDGAQGSQSMLGTVTLSDGGELLIEVQYVRVGAGFRPTGAQG